MIASLRTTAVTTTKSRKSDLYLCQTQACHYVCWFCDQFYLIHKFKFSQIYFKHRSHLCIKNNIFWTMSLSHLTCFSQYPKLKKPKLTRNYQKAEKIKSLHKKLWQNRLSCQKKSTWFHRDWRKSAWSGTEASTRWQHCKFNTNYNKQQYHRYTSWLVIRSFFVPRIYISLTIC